jgi:hypothetical protein
MGRPTPHVAETHRLSPPLLHRRPLPLGLPRRLPLDHRPVLPHALHHDAPDVVAELLPQQLLGQRAVILLVLVGERARGRVAVGRRPSGAACGERHAASVHGGLARRPS